MTSLLKIFTNKQLFKGCLKQSFDITTIRSKTRIPNISKKRHPEWLPKPQHVLHNEHLTVDNQKFLQEIVESKYGTSINRAESRTSPLKIEPIEPVTEWTKQSRRTGLIVKKIGIYPLWLKNGKKVSSTLLQVVDNQVIKYIPPENFNPVKRTKHIQVKKKLGCLIVGAESINPQLLTKEYFGLFKDTGVIPKRALMRFLVSPDAALQPGTPLYAAHFKAGDIIDVRAKTIDRGFQGVMKRWGFKGMPASHGVTKTHRRPGNIGSGGTKARVMPGTKLPGHMGNRWRVHRGLKILRVNTKYNVIWVMGHNIPGETNSYCYIYDTVLPLKKLNAAPYFPTYLPAVHKEPLPEELYADYVHSFKDPTIEFNE